MDDFELVSAETFPPARLHAAFRAGEVLAFALVAPRVELGHWRLATMGAVPEARGSGAAPALLDDFIERARAASPSAWTMPTRGWISATLTSATCRCK